MVNYKKIVILLVLVIGGLGAQQPPPYNYALQAPVPPGVTNISSSLVGAGTGNASYTYWVIARYPSGYVLSPNYGYIAGVGPLSVSNYIRVSWQAVSNALSYTVVRATNGVFPGGGCTGCVVVSGTTSTQVNDDGTALTDLGGITFQTPATGSISLQNTGPRPRFLFSPELDTGIEFNAKDFGAKDGGLFDNATAFQAASDAAHAVGFGTVYIPAGDYLLTGGETFYGKNPWRGSGVDVTRIIFSSTAVTNGITLDGGSGVLDTVELSNLTIISNSAVNTAVRVNNTYGGYINNVKVLNGVNAIVYGDDVKYTRMEQVVIAGYSNRGFSTSSDTSAENYFTNTNIGSSESGAVGFRVSRTTATDIGAYFLTRVTIGGNTTGIEFTSTVQTFSILFCNLCVVDGAAANAVSMTLAKNVVFDGGWVGGSNNAFYFAGSKYVLITNMANVYSSGGGALVGLDKAGATETTAVTFKNNLWFQLGDRIFDAYVGASPVGTNWGGNMANMLPFDTTDATVILSGRGAQEDYQSSPVFVTNGNLGGAVGLFDVANNKKFWLRNTNGVFECVNNAFNAVVCRITDDGTFTINRIVNSTAPTSCSGQLSGTVWNDTGTAKFCP